MNKRSVTSFLVSGAMYAGLIAVALSVVSCGNSNPGPDIVAETAGDDDTSQDHDNGPATDARQEDGLIPDTNEGVSDFPCIEVRPNPLDMGLIAVGSTATDHMEIINLGEEATLEIFKVEALATADGFTFKWVCDRKTDHGNAAAWATDKDAPIPIVFDAETPANTVIDDSICAKPVRVMGLCAIDMPVSYDPISAQSATVTFRFYTNDPRLSAEQGGDGVYEATVLVNQGS